MSLRFRQINGVSEAAKGATSRVKIYYLQHLMKSVTKYDKNLPRDDSKYYDTS